MRELHDDSHDGDEEGFETDLDFLIGCAIQEYRSAHDHLRPDSFEQESFVSWERWALQLVSAAGDLATTSADSDDGRRFEVLRLIAEDEELGSVLRDRVRVRVAESLCQDTLGMSQRCLELTSLVIRTRPAVAVQRFLRRLSRCYISGMFPEVVILCRSVLESALNDAYRSTGTRLPVNGKGVSPMRARLDDAQRRGWLSATARRNAWTIWLRGNKAVHDDPEATHAAFESIAMTMSTVSELTSAT